jgi:hypothetical protein
MAIVVFPQTGWTIALTFRAEGVIFPLQLLLSPLAIAVR